MRTQTDRPLTRRGVVPAALACVLALASVAGYIEGRRIVDNGMRPAVQAVAAAQAAGVTAELQSDAARLSTAAMALGNSPTHSADRSAFVPGDPSEAVGVAAPGASGALTFTPIVESSSSVISSLTGTDLSTRPEWLLAFWLARDGANTVTASAGGGPQGASIIIEAQPLYGTPTPPATVVARRQAIMGYVVLAEPAASLGTLLTRGLGGNIAVRVTQNAVVLASTRAAAPSKTIASAVVGADGVSWVVQAWSTQKPSTLPLIRLLIGLFLAVVVGLASAAGERRSEGLARDAVARANELGLVARSGALLQESLELADLLPLFVVEIGDQLDLSAVSISLMSESGELVRAFSVGSDDGQDAIPLDGGGLPGPIDPGGRFQVPLQRGGRVVGTLAAVANSGLGPSQVEAVRAVSDLLAAAVGNVLLFQEEQDMVARLRDLDRMKSTFLGSVSHELRTTVIAIEGFAGLLATQSAQLDETRRADFVERIRRNARSLGLLIEDLLDSARLERLGNATPLQPVDLTDLVPKVVDQMSSILGQRPVFTTIAPDVVTLGDAAAIERILVNLLSNAAKYTPEGTEVSVTLAKDDAAAVLSVADRGPGIAVADRERIFDRFYRVDNEAGRTIRGVGIGLALAKQYTEALRGTILADETPGGGARFVVAIPLAVDAPRQPLTQPS